MELFLQLRCRFPRSGSGDSLYTLKAIQGVKIVIYSFHMRKDETQFESGI